MIRRRRATLSAVLRSVLFMMMCFDPHHAMAQGTDEGKPQKYLRSEDEEKFWKYLYSESNKLLAAKAMSSIPETVLQRCSGLTVKGGQVLVLRQMSFGEDGIPKSGAWKQEYPVNGCADDMVLNLFFDVGADAKVNAMVGLPGSTRAGLVLQTDATRQVIFSVSAKAAQCPHVDIKNTRFEGYGLPEQKIPGLGGNAPNPTWRETWTLIGCGRTFDVPLNFIPSEHGGTFIAAGKVIER